MPSLIEAVDHATHQGGDAGAFPRAACRHGSDQRGGAALRAGRDRGCGTGARRTARRGAGAFGDIGCFSFYPGKNLGACGEGGAITTDNAEYAAKIRSLRDWGQMGKYNHVLQGYNYRMDAVQAAALDVKLRQARTPGTKVAGAWRMPTTTVCRRRCAGRAGRSVQDHVCHVYAIEVDDREALRARLNDAGVATNIHYPRPVHLQPAYSNLGYGPGDFPISEVFARQTLSLPIYPELAFADVQRVISAVNLHAAEPAAAVA